MESDPAVMRQPAGNQPSHYAKARSAVEACPPQRAAEATLAPSVTEAAAAALARPAAAAALAPSGVGYQGVIIPIVGVIPVIPIVGTTMPGTVLGPDDPEI